MTQILACIRNHGEACLAVAAGMDAVLLQGGTGEASLAGSAGQVPAGALEREGAETVLRIAGATVLVVSGDSVPGPGTLDVLQAAGRAGVLIAAAERLVDAVPLPRLGALAEACRARRLLCGFAGGLESPDVPRLLGFDPDFLVFGRALRRGRRRDGELDALAMGLIRDLVPRTTSGCFGPGQESVATSPSAAEKPIARMRHDRIFVRDLVLEIAIGAYASEFGRKQRVRFTVEADIIANNRPTRDMRDVVSYDLLSDAIRQVATAGHVEFVETLAEAVAARVLAHRRVASVRVVVEKLDFEPGSIGVEIWREATMPEDERK
jgi:(5-formylfuran-3-yl)methyl phosphate synthase